MNKTVQFKPMLFTVCAEFGVAVLFSLAGGKIET